MNYPLGFAVRVLGQALAERCGVVVYYHGPETAKAFGLIRRIRAETELVMRDHEAYQIFIGVKGTAKVSGDIAEVGTYRGGSAKIICEAKGERCLHLFDTFEGIPRVESVDATLFYRGQYAASLDDVKRSLEPYENVHFHAGVFPATTEPIKATAS